MEGLLELESSSSSVFSDSSKAKRLRNFLTPDADRIAWVELFLDMFDVCERRPLRLTSTKLYKG